MNTISKNQNGGIRATSSMFENMEGICSDNYDLVIITSSWDKRCLSLTNLSFTENSRCILLLFDDKDQDGKREENDKVINNWASNNFREIDVINGKSVQVEDVFNNLFYKLVEICVNFDRPINILYDLSTCPRFISLSLLSKSFEFGLVKSIDFFYKECRYPDRTQGIIGENEIFFTSGEWKSIAVHNLRGQYDPGRKSRLIVSAGFEGSKTLRTLNKEDPDSVFLLVPDPGFTEQYISRVMEANAELIKNEDISEKSILRSHAGDAVDVWKKIEGLTERKEYNEKLFCAGSKPHSLGMALSAISNRNLALVYGQLQEHTPVEIEPVDNCWLYKVVSTTVPS